ncbi:MAG: hypothetical protein WAK18_05715, partial [Nocardioidaceae bacterium]
MRAAFRPSSPVAITALLLGLTSLVAVTPAEATSTQVAPGAAIPGSLTVVGPAYVAPQPVKPHVSTYPVHGVTTAGLRALAATSGKSARALAATPGLAAVSAPE